MPSLTLILMRKSNKEQLLGQRSPGYKALASPIHHPLLVSNSDWLLRLREVASGALSLCLEPVTSQSTHITRQPTYKALATLTAPS